MFCALADNYTQPIAVYGVKGAMKGNILAKLVVQCIAELHKIGAIICDAASINRKIWEEVGISGCHNNLKNWFINPVDD